MSQKKPRTADDDAGTGEQKAWYERWKRPAISAFILFHLVLIASWSVPLNSLLFGAAKRATETYALCVGLFQYWDMFAPSPPDTVIYVEAEITYRDGQTRVWKFPRMEQLGIVDKYFKERYRKWANERLRLDANAALWPDAARYIARLNTEPTNPPQTVKLVRYWSQIPPPPSLHQPPVPEHWNHYVFFTYQVQPGDLS